MKKAGMAFALVLVTSAGPAAAQTAVAAARTEASWELVACPFDASRAMLPVRCGRLRVPENPDDRARSIEIAVMIVSPRRDVDPQNPVLFLHGGPGGNALALAERMVATPWIRDTVVDRDWVFFDQRGTGRSTPALYCPPGEDYFARLRACRDQLIGQGIDLSQYNSARSAGDVEALRHALGVRQWNLWGASYGSRLAFTVARYFPASVRAIVHDGPDLPEDQEVVDDLRGTEGALNKLFSKCAADAACASRFPQLRSRFLAALLRIRQQPLSVGSERIDDSRAMQFIRNTLFGGSFLTLEHRVQNVLAFIDAAARGDGARMLQIEQGMAQQEESARAGRSEAPVPVQGRSHLGQALSIDCNEEKSFESLDEYARAAARSEIVRSLLGNAADLDQIFRQCALWPSGRAAPIENSPVDYDGPQLAFTGELDASLSGLAGYEIDMLYANATNVVFRNGEHLQANMENASPAEDYNYYRACALRLARQFLADPRRELDTSCAETRRLRLVP